MEKGYVQIYTGNGKGKTTAALGLGLRAAGSGLKVIMFQFLKGMHSGELDSAPLLGSSFKIYRLAESNKFFGAMNDAEKKELGAKLSQELVRVREVMEQEVCEVLILDEIMAALHRGLLTVEEICALVDARPPGMELVMTGRNAPQELIDRADLVTNMGCVKHYLDVGVASRRGIEK